MAELNPFVERFMNGEWEIPIPKDDYTLRPTSEVEREYLALQRLEYFRHAKACADQFKIDALAECNLTNEPDVEALYLDAQKDAIFGCLSVYLYLADIAEERGLYVRLPW